MWELEFDLTTGFIVLLPVSPFPFLHSPLFCACVSPCLKAVNLDYERKLSKTEYILKTS